MPTLTPLPSSGSKSSRASAARSCTSPSETISPEGHFGAKLSGVRISRTPITRGAAASARSSAGLAATVTVW